LPSIKIGLIKMSNENYREMVAKRFLDDWSVASGNINRYALKLKNNEMEIIREWWIINNKFFTNHNIDEFNEETARLVKNHPEMATGKLAVAKSYVSRMFSGTIKIG